MKPIKLNGWQRLWVVISCLLLIALPNGTQDVRNLSNSLLCKGIKTLSPGYNRAKDTFRREGHVTVAGIYRAKGNEAWKVYACGVHVAGKSFVQDPGEELLRRNQVFVALTRARIWCVATGRAGTIMDELASAKAQFPTITFKAFNQTSLKRVIDSAESQKQLFDLVELPVH